MIVSTQRKAANAPFRLAAGFVVALVLAAIGVTNWQLRVSQGDERTRVIEDTEQRATQLVGAVAERMSVLVRSSDFVLRQLRRDYGTDDARFRVLADSLLSSFPAQSLLNFAFTDGDGDVTYSSSRSTGSVNLRDRDYFAAHRDGVDRLVISKPVVGRISKVWALPFSRPILRDGRFAGVVVLTLSPQYVSQVLATLELAPKDTIALTDANGTFLARNRDLGALIGKTLSPVRPFMQPGAAPRGIYRVASFDDGSDRFFAWQRVPDTTLVAVVGLDGRTVLAPLEARFRREWIQAGVVSALLVALGIAVLGLLSRLSRRQRDLTASEARFRGLTGLSSDWYWEQDVNFRFTVFEGASRNRSGLTASDHLGKARWELPTLNMTDADWAAHRAQLEAHLPFRDLEVRRPDADGRMHWVSSTGEPVFDDHGAFSGYRGIGRDISERKQAEHLLRASEEKLRQLIDGLGPDIFVGLMTTDGVLIEANRPALAAAGLQRQDVIGKPFEQTYWWAYSTAIQAQLRAAIEQAAAGNAARFDVQVRVAEGVIVWIDFSLQPLRDTSGEIIYLVPSAMVIDARRRAEQDRQQLEAQLHQAQKMESLGTLAGGIAHDFNNNLAVIFGNVERARQDAGADSPVQRSLAEIARAAQRARDLVRQILTFSRRQPLDRRLISLQDVAQDAVELLRASLPKGIELVATFAPDTPNVVADRSQIHQVLMNLGANAGQAIAGQQGRIEIALAGVTVGSDAAGGVPAPGRYARLSVSDNGPGMDAATRDRIFDPFFTTKAVGEGTGLGLAVVDGIVKGHYGAITVDSAPGRGSAFHLYFPATAGGSAVVAEPPRAAPWPGMGQRILYLDDEPALVMIAQAMLERLGYRVQGHTVATQALAAFKADPAGFDLLVTDFNMPGATGLEVAGEMLRLRPDLPVALASGFLTDELREQAEALGIREVIHKPHSVEDLAAAIERALAGPA